MGSFGGSWGHELRAPGGQITLYFDLGIGIVQSMNKLSRLLFLLTNAKFGRKVTHSGDTRQIQEISTPTLHRGMAQDVEVLD